MSERLSGREPKPQSAAEKREQILQRVDEGFQQLVRELEQGHTQGFLDYLAFCARFHKYSRYNQLLIRLQRPNATFVAGYRRWQTLGFQVKKGEQGIAILAPVTYRRKQDEEDDEEAEKAADRLVGFRVRYVFDASQLDLSGGKSLPVFWRELPDDQEAVFELVKQAVEASGIRVEEGRVLRGAQGVSQGGKVVLATGRDSRSRTMTLVHEWTHELLHKQWLGEGERRELSVQTRECQAEAVAYIVCRYLDIENPFARDYLLSYGNTAAELVANLDQVQRASHVMIEQLQLENVAQYGQRPETRRLLLT